MKKVVALLMVVVFCVSLCGCIKKPTKEELIVEANRYIATQDASNEEFDANGNYSAEYNGYYVIVELDVDYFCSEQGLSPDSLEGRAMLVYYESAYEELSDLFINTLFEGLEEIFADSDVEVRVVYRDRQGDLTKGRTSSQE